VHRQFCPIQFLCEQRKVKDGWLKMKSKNRVREREV